jgi:hypothetical protein
MDFKIKRKSSLHKKTSLPVSKPSSAHPKKHLQTIQTHQDREIQDIIKKIQIEADQIPTKPLTVS